MSLSDDDWFVFDVLLRFFVLMIEFEAYREAKLIYDYLTNYHKDAEVLEEIFDDYISTFYDAFPHFEFENIGENLTKIVKTLDLSERLIKDLPQKSRVKKIKV